MGLHHLPRLILLLSIPLLLILFFLPLIILWFLPFTFPQSQPTSAIVINSVIWATSSIIQSSTTSTSYATSFVPSIPKIANKPWNNPGAIQMTPPLHPLPKHSERWLPKFNPDDGLPAEEHLHDFMLTINLSGDTKEDVVCRLFPYTFEGSAGSWYFSLPIGSITNWDMFEEHFLLKFGDYWTTATLINDLSNLKTNPNEKINDFNSRFKILLNKIPDTSRHGIDV